MTPVQPLSTNARWQIAFLLSFISLIVLGAFVLGVPLVLAVAGVFGICLAALNALISRTPAPDSQPVVGYIQRALNATRLLKSATTILVLLDIGLISTLGTAVVRHMRSTLVAGNIKSASHEAVQDATVVLKLPNHEFTTTTTKDGHFSITAVGVNSAARLQVQYKDIRIDRLLSDFSRPSEIDLQLPPGSPPFRLSYYLLGGHAFGLVKDNRVPARLLPEFSPAPFIVPTRVHRFYEHLKSRYSDDLDWYSLQRDGSDETVPNADKLKPLRVLAGVQENLEDSVEFTEKNVMSMLHNPAWNVVPQSTFSPSDPDWLGSLVLWKSCDEADIKRFGQSDEAMRMHQELTKSGVPPAYCIVVVQPSDEGSQDRNCPNFTVFEGRLYFRRPNVRVAVLENIANHSFELQSFKARQVDLAGIRSFKEDQTHLEAAPEENTPFFAHHVLLPGEKVLVPIQFVLTFDSQEREALSSLTDQIPEGVSRELRGKIRHVRIGAKSFAISGEELAQKISRNDPKEVSALVEQQYVAGPSIKLTAISTGDVQYPASAFQEEAAFIRSDLEGGSCPFLYIYFPEKQQWVKWDHVLYRASSPQLLRRDVLKVPIVGNKILLREAEDETSFIRRISLIVKTADGQEVERFPDQVPNNPEHYWILHQGESVIVKFSGDNLPGETFLSIEGYYIPKSRVNGLP